MLVGMVFQVLEAPLQLQDRFFKIQGMGFHMVDCEWLRKSVSGTGNLNPGWNGSTFLR
jgi:hypothetical protein